VTFESGSRLERIEESAFYGSGLKSILIPGGIEVARELGEEEAVLELDGGFDDIFG
jgi:hypothetical protein